MIIGRMLDATLPIPSPTAAVPPTPTPDGALRLTDWGVIRASGADTAAFLHGQLTQDVTHWTEGQARLAGYCSPKGRLMASFVIWRGGAEEWLLACSADLLPAVLKRLSMFVMRSRCRLSDASADLPLWGVAGTTAATAWGATGAHTAWQQQPHAGGTLIALPASPWPGQADTVPRWLWAGAEPSGLASLPARDWQALEVLAGLPRIVAATSECFVPQMVNLELVGGVHFQKGCYPGQEVVARSQYRGTLKRRMQLLYGAPDTPLPLPAQEIFHADDPGQPAGQVVLAAPLPDGRVATLAELKLAALGGRLHLGTPDGPELSLGALPYALTLDAI